MTSPPDRERDEQFRSAYHELYPKIAGYAWNLTRDREAAHEVAQETFARLFDRWDKIEDPTAYGFRIATNLTRALWRRTNADRAGLHALAQQRLLDPGPQDATTAIAVRQVVDALPRRYRQLVLLHYFADLPLPESVSDRLCVSAVPDSEVAGAGRVLGEECA